MFVVGILMLFVAVGWGFYGWRAWVLLVEPTLTKWEFNWQRRKIGLTEMGERKPGSFTAGIATPQPGRRCCSTYSRMTCNGAPPHEAAK